MLEKLPFEITKGEYEGKSFDIKSPTSQYDMQEKINELVDAVNGILDYAPLEMAMKAEPKPADPYAEQRKWIGKLCRFWYSNEKYADLGILQAITPANTPNKYLKKDSCNWYSNCKPVKPEDNIIYKGGDNE